MVSTEVATLRAQVAEWRAAGERVALVPTMGALHAGHISLITAARAAARRVVVTIFVNPKQFAPHEDFSAYPRNLAADQAAVAAAGADLVYAPALPAMYPEGFATTVRVDGPAVAGLEDRFRPSHFAGVATIVAKLLLQAQVDIAVFGEKDFQQLRMIERLVLDLDIPVAIASVPTLREADGLAMSSRNVYLSAEERARAPVLHQALARAAAAIEEGAPAEAALDAARERIAAAGFAIDYVEARDATTLAPTWPETFSSPKLRRGSAASHHQRVEEPGEMPGAPGRILAAARLGRTRLIDNVPIRRDRPLPPGGNTTG